MANGLAAAFIADNSANAVLTCSTLNGQSWSANTDIGQASNGTAPSLAVLNNKLWVAFVANNPARSVLVCSSSDGVHWSGDTDIGQASQSAPSLAAFNDKLQAAFVANNALNTVLVCSSSDGVHWSGATDIGQASNGTAPSLAVLNNKLWVAFVANNPARSVLVCSSSDGVHWSGDTDIGQASQSAPSLAAFNDKLQAAFVANNALNTVLVCSSSDGVHWSVATDIGQASNGTAPSLAVLNNKLWVAFVANNPARSVLVCSSSDGVHWSGDTEIGQASQSAPSLAAFENFSPNAVPPPPSGLGSNSNYILYSNCRSMLGVSISICVTEDIVSNIGFGFQLNAYSPKNKTSAWQQYVIAVLNAAELTGGVDNWPVSGNNIINHSFSLCPLGGANTVPAGHRLTISLHNDANGNITGATYVVIDSAGITQASVTTQLLSIPGVTEADLAPIVAFELNLVGPDNGQSATLSSGAGTITYSASTQRPLTVINQEPSSCTESGYITGETANSVYGAMPADPSSSLTQSFRVDTERPMIRRTGTRVLKLTR